MLLSGVCLIFWGVVLCSVCGVCACGFSLMRLCVVLVMDCVMVHGSCVCCVFVWVFRFM